MKTRMILGILTAFTVSACAPVASSVPKMGPASPRTKDSIVSNGKDRDQVKKEIKVVSAAKYDQLERKLDADFKLVKYDEKELSSLKELNQLEEIEIPSALKALEIVVIFVTKSEEKALSEEGTKDLAIDWSRTKKDRFHLSVGADGKSGAAWSTIKGDLAGVTIAYREMKTKD